MHPKHLTFNDFNHDLPEEKIAAYPLENRSQSRLLINEGGSISEDTYQNIAEHLPTSSFLVFNDTKVIKARILFQKITGAVIEIFCLKPNYVINSSGIILQQKKNPPVFP